MANKRIIDLTAAGSFALTDLLEIDTGTLSLKITGQQVYNLIAATLNTTNPVQFSNSAILVANTGINVGPALTFINNDGSASFANGNFIINAVGNAQFSGQVGSGNDIEITNQNKGLILRSRPSAIRYRLIFDDAGQIGTEPA
jgi:hypothetical protein